MGAEIQKLFLANFSVSGCIHEGVNLRGVGDFHLHNPVGVSVLVNEFGSILKSLVDFNYLAADGRHKVAGSLYGLHGAELFAGCDFIST